MRGGSPDFEMSLSDLSDNLTDYTQQANQSLENQWILFSEESNFQPVLTLSRSQDVVNALTIYGDGEVLVEINVSTGEHKFGPKYVPSEAADIFWEAVGRTASSAAQLTDATDTIEKTKKVLGVREGDSIVLTAQARMDHIEWLRRKNDELGLQLRKLSDNPDGRLPVTFAKKWEDIRVEVETINIPAHPRKPGLEITSEQSPPEFANAIGITRTILPKKVQAVTNFDDAMKVAKDL